MSEREDGRARQAQWQRWRSVADLYHAFFTGLILSVVTRRGTADAAEIILRDRDGFRLYLRINPITARVELVDLERQ